MGAGPLRGVIGGGGRSSVTACDSWGGVKVGQKALRSIWTAPYCCLMNIQQSIFMRKVLRWQFCGRSCQISTLLNWQWASSTSCYAFSAGCLPWSYWWLDCEGHHQANSARVDALAKTFNFKGHGTKHAFEDLTLKDITNGEQTSANLFGVASIVDTHISCCELFHVFLVVNSLPRSYTWRLEPGVTGGGGAEIWDGGWGGAKIP